MAKKLQAIRGMNDILPADTNLWTYLEKNVREVLTAYGYSEIRLPILEMTDLFARSIGEVTDIVEKEMYTFTDRSGDSLTLRPEGTAGCVRACIEHGLLHNQQQRLWYAGPMFRHERPQKGRYRQFHQIGVEAYGMTGPDIDAELILMTARLWKKLKLDKYVTLEINSLGTSKARARYRNELVAYLQDHFEQLDEDSRRRLHSNPLRILDSKNPDLQALIEAAPKLMEHLDQESLDHFAGLKARLDAADLSYRVNPRLVRGLDYYSKTVFEWVTDHLGAQGTVCAGGRYDSLVEQLGGRATPGVGFAMGLERLVALLGEAKKYSTKDLAPKAYLIMVGEEAEIQGLALAEKLRNEIKVLRLLQVNCGGGKLSNQLKRADKSGARYALILAEQEIMNYQITVKDLKEGEQFILPQYGLGEWLEQRISKPKNRTKLRFEVL